MKRVWKIQPKVAEDVRKRFPELDPIHIQLLANRGLTTQEAVDEFLHPDYGQDLHDPFLFRDMQKAVERLTTAIDHKEKVLLYGDYDVDGVSSVALLSSVLGALQVPTVDSYIPDRVTEGYGLNMDVIKQFAEQGTTLLVTCDCGTSNSEEIALANSLGMDVIVVDHHKQPQTPPAAYAFINPAFPDEPYPWKKLCSTGIAFKLATALLQHLDYGKGRLVQPLPMGWEKWLLDLVALATVADMMLLQGENRTLVQHGLLVLKKTRRLGLQALARAMGTDLQDVTAGVIGFRIAPRLNAAGRLRHARSALALLTTEDPEEAERLAQELHATNTERQVLTERMCTEAIQQITEGEIPILVATHGQNWPSGVVGLVAGRLKERFHRPALAVGEENGRLVGSGRSIAGFDITEALVASSKHLLRFGGHPMACGFTLRSPEDLEPFFSSMRKHAKTKLADNDLLPILLIDMEIYLEQITWGLADAIETFEPFGIGVPAPAFLSRSLSIIRCDRVGRDGKHLRLRVAQGTGRSMSAIGFSLGSEADRIQVGSKIDAAYRVSINEWNGNRELQLEVIDLQPL